MSGGSMEYVHARIEEAADQVNFYLHDTMAKKDEEFAFDASRKNVSPEKMKEEVVLNLKTAVLALRMAGIYAQRVEWLMSGDDGYDSFVMRTSEELGELGKEMKEKGFPNGICLSSD